MTWIAIVIPVVCFVAGWYGYEEWRGRRTYRATWDRAWGAIQIGQAMAVQGLRSGITQGRPGMELVLTLKFEDPKTDWTIGGVERDLVAKGYEVRGGYEASVIDGAIVSVPALTVVLVRIPEIPT